MMALSSMSMADIRRHALTLAVWTLSLLASAGLTAYLSYLANQRANSQLAVQQQLLTDLQRFENSGGELDSSVRVLSDSLIEREGILQARIQVRAAVAKHATDTLSLRARFGDGPTQRYMEELAKLRAFADESDSIDDGQNVWQTAIETIQMRQGMVSAERSRQT